VQAAGVPPINWASQVLCTCAVQRQENSTNGQRQLNASHGLPTCQRRRLPAVCGSFPRGNGEQ
jgi:hypothetical protein